MRSGTDGRVVVIGAGVGGLAAAVRLAAAGLDVTVLDRQGGPGGKMRTVESAAGPVDAGPTVLTMRHVFDAIFAEAGARLDDHITLVREPLLARHFWPDGSTLDLFDDPERSASAIRAWGGPQAETDFRAFSAMARRLCETFEAPIMQAPAPAFASLVGHVATRPGLIPTLAPHRTLGRALAARFRDPRLRQLFGRYATYVGGSPFAAPAVLSLIWHTEERGVWRVKGGMHRLAVALRALAERNGATFHFGADAERIEVQSGRAAGVRTTDGRRFRADHIIFNGDPRALAMGLLGDPSRGAVPRRAMTEPRSHSAYVWTFAAAPSGPLASGLAHHNVLFSANPKSEFDDISAGRPPSNPTLYICAEDRGIDAAPRDGPERFEIIINGPPTTLGSPEDPATCRTRTFQALARHGLIFSPLPESAALTTPAGFDSLFPGSAGSLYGRSPHGLLAAFSRPTARSALPGLYLAGGGVHPGAGIPMAALSGKHAAEAIRTDRTSTSPSRRTATPGGTSTGSPTTARAPSRSSAS